MPGGALASLVVMSVVGSKLRRAETSKTAPRQPNFALCPEISDFNGSSHPRLRPLRSEWQPQIPTPTPAVGNGLRMQFSNFLGG